MNSFPNNKLTIEDVKVLLENHFTGGPGKKLTIADIQKQVESYYKVSHADIISGKRSRNIVYARQIAIYLSRQLLDLPLSFIGKNFGGRDHTTVIYSISNVEEKMKGNREIREEIENIKRCIKEM
jgi:chromosomal replication initiator protein